MLQLATSAADPTNVVARTERAYQMARRDFQSNSENSQLALTLARTCFDLAELGLSDTNRAALGKEGISAARVAISKSPTNAAGYYYLGLNLGEVARTRRMSALKMVSDMEEQFEIALNLDEKFDFAGPDRCLGMLYRDAPGWPMSVGNRSKAWRHLQRALDMCPEYPENWLNLLEAYIDWDDYSRAKRDANLYEKSLPAAKKQFGGERWDGAWIDWDKRWSQIQAKLADYSAGHKRGRKYRAD